MCERVRLCVYVCVPASKRIWATSVWLILSSGVLGIGDITDLCVCVWIWAHSTNPHVIITEAHADRTMNSWENNGRARSSLPAHSGSGQLPESAGAQRGHLLCYRSLVLIFLLISGSLVSTGSQCLYDLAAVRMWRIRQPYLFVCLSVDCWLYHVLIAPVCLKQPVLVSDFTLRVVIHTYHMSWNQWRC